MELSKSMQDALNKQINEELASAYIYLSMAAYCESINLPGFAHWMRAQTNEEMEHAMKFFHYIADRGGLSSVPAGLWPAWSEPGVDAGRRRLRLHGLHAR